MSYSGDVRHELARVSPERDCCGKAELAAMLTISSNINKDDQDGFMVQVTVENAAIARKLFKLTKEVYNLQPAVKFEDRKYFKKTKIFMVETYFSKKDKGILQEIGILDDNMQIKRQVAWNLLGRICCKRAYLRGLFLARGFINSPGANYHMEIVVNDTGLATDIQKLFLRFNLEIRTNERKSNLALYIKESETIADFLRIVGASKALLDFENVRIIKSVRNNVNRQVNCETANLAKTIDASLRQVELIEKLIKTTGLKKLPVQMQNLAMLRIDYPDSTLRELGAMMNPPLSKSGVAYRMKKLERLAEEIEDT